jgi:hypothetical protein
MGKPKKQKNPPIRVIFLDESTRLDIVMGIHFRAVKPNYVIGRRLALRRQCSETIYTSPVSPDVYRDLSGRGLDPAWSSAPARLREALL